MRVSVASPVVSQPRGVGVWTRLGILVGLVVAVFVVEWLWGWPDPEVLRGRVEAAGRLGVITFVAGYAVLCLLPVPKGVLTALGGVLYGLWVGALLSWTAALLGAAVAFGLGRLLGREAVDRLTHGRVRQADRVLAAHGVWAVVAVRLTPVIPFTAINYAAGLTAVRWRHYALGSALGMVPGSLAYAALGAFGSDPWGIFAGLAAFVVLIGVAWLLGQRLLSRGGRDSEEPVQGGR